MVPARPGRFVRGAHPGIMPFLSGILAAWAIIYLILTAGSLFAFLRFQRNRELLFFGLFCAFMGMYNAAGVFTYLAENLQQSIVPGRVQLAALQPASAALLFLGLGRGGLSARAMRALFWAAGSVALVLFCLSLAGLVLDYDRPSVNTFEFWFLGRVVYHQYGFTPLGYAASAYALLSATVGGILLGRSVRSDPLAQGFFFLGVIALNAIAANDILVANNLMQSFFLLEHGLFLLTLFVLVGFIREFELSRRVLQERTRALVQASQKLDRAADETRRLRPMADLGRLSASLAHEIRNPLAVLYNITSALKRRGPDTGGSESFGSLVAMLQEETNKLARLVDDLLLFAQMGRASRQPVEVARLVQDAVSDARARLPLAVDAEIVTELEDDVDPVLGSTDSLKRALANLVINALQSSGESAGVRIVVRNSQRHPYMVAIGVQDSAGGVPEQAVSEIFEPFFSTRSSGAGLGLSIAKGIAEAHDGSLQLENHPEQGATFWMRLPSARSPFVVKTEDKQPQE